MATCGDDDDVPDLLSDNDSEADDRDDEAWEDIDDDDIDEEFRPLHGNVKCLFCSERAVSVEESMKHCITRHDFDLVRACCAADVDCIAYIKMINFIRLKQPSPETVKSQLNQGGLLWSDHEYMAAVDPEDLMLQFDIESAVVSTPNSATLHSAQQSTDSSVNYGEGGRGDNFSESEAIHALVCRVQQAERERDVYKEELDRALQQIEQLKTDLSRCCESCIDLPPDNLQF